MKFPSSLCTSQGQPEVQGGDPARREINYKGSRGQGEPGLPGGPLLKNRAKLANVIK
jgi:hypothetical protein